MAQPQWVPTLALALTLLLQSRHADGPQEASSQRLKLR
jgi:hypothetical protein